MKKLIIFEVVKHVEYNIPQMFLFCYIHYYIPLLILDILFEYLTLEKYKDERISFTTLYRVIFHSLRNNFSFRNNSAQDVAEKQFSHSVCEQYMENFFSTVTPWTKL